MMEEHNAASPPLPVVAPAFSNAQALPNLVALSVLSFGIYPTYWLYRNLKLIKEHKRLAISPAGRTFVAFIPLIGLLFFKDQLQFFAETTSAAGVAESYSPWGRTLGFMAISALAELPNPWWVLATAAVVFLLPVQKALNAYWAIEQPGLPIRRGLTGGETALLIVCGVLWALIVAASLINVEP